MTETTAQPLTREDITAAVVEALSTDAVNLRPGVADDRESVLDRNRSEPRCECVEFLSILSLDPIVSRRRSRSVSSFYDRDRNSRTEAETHDAGSGGDINQAAAVYGLSDLADNVQRRGGIAGDRITATAIAHGPSPSVVGRIDPTIGEVGTGSGTSASPKVGVAIDVLVEAIRDARVDEVAALRLQRAAESNLAEMNENLAYAKNQTRTAELALLDHINGGAA
ncbi:hypothetical protein CBI33_22840 [Rhodococcus erythropolis]|nr:hypothetical protein CBI33_22840 [Rhodococcus erythropolis]